jgi:hypothetical protein
MAVEFVRLTNTFGTAEWINPAGVVTIAGADGSNEVLIQGHGLTISVIGTVESVAQDLGFNLRRLPLRK